MARLLGHVERADKMMLTGWALDAEAPAARPLLQVVQRGEVVAAARPHQRIPDLLGRLGLPPGPHPPLHGWTIPLPLTGGLAPDIAFSVIFAETGRPLEGGEDLIIPTLRRIDAEAARDLAGSILVRMDVAVEPEGVRLHVRALQTDPPRPLTLEVGKGAPRDVAVIEMPKAPPFGRAAVGFRCRIPRARIENLQRPSVPVRLRFPGDEEDTPANFHHRLRTLHLPRSLYAEADRRLPLPAMEHMRRIGGPEADPHHFLMQGLTNFLQLDALVQRHAGRRLTRLPCVVDWGVGCGRVLRHFAESAAGLGLPAPDGQRLVGLDVDPVGLGWCRTYLGAVAEFGLLRPDGFDLPSGSVDLLYGISVMTHLTELDQHVWLTEIARVLKPGGLAILTIHGEFALYGQPASMALPFVERFGFFDGLADAALGEDRIRRYRTTYHGRRLHPRGLVAAPRGPGHHPRRQRLHAGHRGAAAARLMKPEGARVSSRAPHLGPQPSPFAASSTAAACSSGFTLRQTFTTRPSAPTRKLLRSIPM